MYVRMCECACPFNVCVIAPLHMYYIYRTLCKTLCVEKFISLLSVSSP